MGPRRVAPQLAVGGDTIWVLAPDGSLWGAGHEGQTRVWRGYATELRRVGGDFDWKAVCASPYCMLALKTNGTLWIWGGVGSCYPPRPLGSFRAGQVGSASNWVAVASGANHAVALRNDGTLWAWGYNQYGQLGNGVTNQTLPEFEPLQIGKGTNWAAVSAGSSHTLALRRDGTLWLWGFAGTSSNQYSPGQIGTETNWVRIGAGEYYSMAAKRDNTWWGWGENDLQPLTNGARRNLGPSPLGATGTWMQAVGGNTHYLVLDTKGCLWGWGLNYHGMLGPGPSTYYAYPTRIGQRNDWVCLAAGFDSSLGMTADGMLWGWGHRLWEPPKTNPFASLALKVSAVSGIKFYTGPATRSPYTDTPVPVAQFSPTAINR